MLIVDKRAVSLGVSALIVIALILIAGFGLFLNATFNTFSTTGSSISFCQRIPCTTTLALNTTSSNTSGSVSTFASIESVSSTCYSSSLPTNQTISASAQQVLVFNVTTYFDNGYWVSFLGNPIHIGSYTFLAYSPNSTSTSFQLEPQLFINVTSGVLSSTVQRAAWTNLGGLGNSHLSNIETVFDGNVSMQFLFSCQSQNVYFEIMIHSNLSSYGSDGALVSESCLINVQDAPITGVDNSSYIGYKVAFPNETSDYFRMNSCPQPVSTHEYILASVIEQNPSFIAAENGSVYYVQQGVAGGISKDVTYVTITFTKWSNETFQPCGPSFGWTLYALSQIQVSVPTDSYNSNDLNSFDFSNMTISVIPSYMLNVYNCPTIISTSSG